METVTDFIFLDSTITADGDCSHEIKRRLLLGRKAMTNLDSVLKSRDIVNKGTSSQRYGFSSGHVWMWELDCEQGWAPGAGDAQGGLERCSPRGREESDTTERLNTPLSVLEIWIFFFKNKIYFNLLWLKTARNKLGLILLLDTLVTRWSLSFPKRGLRIVT